MFEFQNESSEWNYPLIFAVKSLIKLKILSDLTTGKTGTIVVVNESIQRYSFIRIYIGFFHPLFNKSYSCETTKDLKDRIDVR